MQAVGLGEFQIGDRIEILVRSYRLEIGRREGLLRLVDAVFVAVVAETILERFVHVAAQDGHTGHIDVLNLQRTLGRRSLRLRTFVVLHDQTDGETHRHRIETVQMRIAAHLHGRLELAQLGTVLGVHVACGNIVGSVGECCILTDRTDEGHVRKDTGGERRSGRTFAVVIALETVRRRGIGNAGLTYAQAELHLAAESVVGIEIVIPGVVGNQVFGIYRTAEPFVGVVVGVGHLHMVDLRSRSHRTERDGIDLLVLLEGIAGELAAHVTQSTRTVGIVAASVRSAGTALDLLLAVPLLFTPRPQRMIPPQSPGRRLPAGISEVKTIGSLCVPLAHNWPPGSTMSAALVSLSPLIIVPGASVRLAPSAI